MVNWFLIVVFLLAGCTRELSLPEKPLGLGDGPEPVEIPTDEVEPEDSEYDKVDLFDDSVINEVHLEVSEDMIGLLNGGGSGWGEMVDDHIPTYVDHFAFTDVRAGREIVFSEVSAALAGQMSFTPIPGKSGYRLDLNDGHSGRSLGGYDDLRLRNLLYGGRLREWLFYQKIFPHFGQPAAQAAHIWFSASYLPDGLKLDYLLLEAVKDDALDRMYGKDQWLAAWEGVGGDLPNVECQEGDCFTIDLQEFMMPFYDQSAPLPVDGRLDWPTFWRFWALEIALGQWDGYIVGVHNFFVVALPNAVGSDRAYRLEFLPHGLDLAMGSIMQGPPVDEFLMPPGANGYGSMIAAKCMTDDWCRQGLLTALEDMSRTWSSAGFDGSLAERRAFLSDAGMWYPEDDRDYEYLTAYVAARPQALAMAALMYADVCEYQGLFMPDDPRTSHCEPVPVDTGYFYGP